MFETYFGKSYAQIYLQYLQSPILQTAIQTVVKPYFHDVKIGFFILRTLKDENIYSNK